MRKTAKFVLWFATALFAGSTIWQYVHYLNHPDLYAAWSAPWYTPVLIRGIAALAVGIICIVILIVTRRKR